MAAEVLGAWAREIEELGIEVKGPWLVDFDSGGGYYLLEVAPRESLEFFHGYERGLHGPGPAFSSRRDFGYWIPSVFFPAGLIISALHGGSHTS